MGSLLLISIGPVQDFIATARTCQDLWFGSRLLSALAETVARAVETAGGDQALIFPAELTHLRPAVANKILVKVDHPETVVKAAREALDTGFREIVARMTARAHQAGVVRDVFDAQLTSVLEFDYVSVRIPSGGSAASYEQARRDAEGWLAATKCARPWVAGDRGVGHGVPKCSVCGARDSVIHEDLFEEYSDRPAELWRRYRVGAGERLCAVELIKRWGVEPGTRIFKERPPFHSTSHVAAASLRAAVARTGTADAIESYVEGLRGQGLDVGAQRVNLEATTPLRLVDPLSSARVLETDRAFGGTHTDGRVFYEGQLRSLLREERRDDAPAYDETQLEDARVSQRAALDAVGVGEPFGYYAFLLADGDKMGAAIERVADENRHRDLSEGLQRFSQDARGIIESHHGSQIYAGGDDVLALVPVLTAIQAAHDLKERFNSAMRSVFRDGEVLPTLSVGLAFVHHLEPMTRARRLAKRAEHLAKNGPDGTRPEHKRNALAVVFSPRGGGDIEWRTQWGIEDEVCRRMWEWARRFLAEELPHGAPHHLLEQLAQLEVRASDATPNVGWPVATEPVVRSLVRRILGRRKTAQGDSVDVVDLEEACGDRASSRALAHELLVARLMARAYREAWGSLPEPVAEEEEAT